MTIPLQTEIVYGPLQSRRFGRSLGINLLPAGEKICSLDCLYCQYGLTAHERHNPFPSIEEVEADFRARLEEIEAQSGALDWVMIAGNGEPTLHPQFEAVLDRLVAVRNQMRPWLPIGILSNASTCHHFHIRRSLARLEGRFMKLDAGSHKIFESINQPLSEQAWNRVVTGLHQMHRLVLQSMFIGGRVDNTDEVSVRDWIDAVRTIRPEAVQIYTVDRVPAFGDVLPVDSDILRKVARRLQAATGIEAQVFINESETS